MVLRVKCMQSKYEDVGSSSQDPFKIAHTYNSISGIGWRQGYSGDLLKRSAPDSIKDLVSENTEPGSGGWLRSLIPAFRRQRRVEL